MRKLVSSLLLSCLVFQPLLTLGQTPAPAGNPNEVFSGYSPQDTATERQWEEKFRALPDPAEAKRFMQLLSARPHNVGTAYDKQNAEWILSKFKEWGWQAHIEQFDVLFPTPKQRLVELVAPTHYVAKLEEPTVAGDPTSGQKAEQLPTYNAYSIDGDVTAPLVYVNYGIPADYVKLDRLGISVKGAIVIARYGHSWRGIKPKVAAEHGAVGCIIYSDPRDDGYFAGDTFPNGPMRPLMGVQRGSVMDMPLYPGDPLTPGVGSVPGVKRLALTETKSLTTIPVLPISYGDAQPLLAALKGPLAPKDWRGALAMTYHVGPGPAKVHLVVKSNWDTKPVYDVIAKMPGQDPDQWVVRGNHHDAWVNGAEDPIAGQVALLEEARSLGELAKQGWKPKRTLIYCAWDGEEPMLLGSTEWAEQHAKELQQHAAIYINTDGNDRGFLTVEGSHSLEHFVNETAKEVQDPESGMTVLERTKLAAIHAAKDKDDRDDARKRADWRLGPLGSGSDYTVFIDHLGIASLNVAYNGESDGGIYHSIYDDFYWYTHFADTKFVYSRALSQTVGTEVMRFADSDLLPYEFTDLADTTKKYLKELQELDKKQREQVAEQNMEISEGTYKAINDPEHPKVTPKEEAVPAAFDFSPLQQATDALAQSASQYQQAVQAASLARAPANTLQEINTRLIQAERHWLADQGLYRRPWYKNMLYAPGWYTGYGSKTMPGVREAIDEKRYNDVQPEIARLAKVVQDEAAYIQSVAGDVQKLK